MATVQRFRPPICVSFSSSFALVQSVTESRDTEDRRRKNRKPTQPAPTTQSFVDCSKAFKPRADSAADEEDEEDADDADDADDVVAFKVKLSALSIGEFDDDMKAAFVQQSADSLGLDSADAVTVIAAAAGSVVVDVRAVCRDRAQADGAAAQLAAPGFALVDANVFGDATVLDVRVESAGEPADAEMPQAEPPACDAEADDELSRAEFARLFAEGDDDDLGDEAELECVRPSVRLFVLFFVRACVHSFVRSTVRGVGDALVGWRVRIPMRWGSSTNSKKATREGDVSSVLCVVASTCAFLRLDSRDASPQSRSSVRLRHCPRPLSFTTASPLATATASACACGNGRYLKRQSNNDAALSPASAREASGVPLGLPPALVGDVTGLLAQPPLLLTAQGEATTDAAGAGRQLSVVRVVILEVGVEVKRGSYTDLVA